MSVVTNIEKETVVYMQVKTGSPASVHTLSHCVANGLPVSLGDGYSSNILANVASVCVTLVHHSIFV